jgi:hypothetical protein
MGRLVFSHSRYILAMTMEARPVGEMPYIYMKTSANLRRHNNLELLEWLRDEKREGKVHRKMFEGKREVSKRT